ncbi:retron St85 family RNA-directed DNA polymerase [Duganella sp. BJB476]|uniref:retron St85 family RNA-directed DNA polymerase n=1 Tax=Duganella sp. BJB476 TaxID=1871176 RepID=UPI000E34FC36|nr:retron St85 family RNA-directed DNA polymerase [Duganella sp. BJB476]RFP31429.1 RNA-directed DNA polymerase [Duganella sp. BJB476]
MSHTRINESILLWAIGVIQPGSPAEAIEIIEKATKSKLPPGSAEGITLQCEHYVQRGLLRLVHKKKNWYSLTHLGDVSIPKVLRRRRDRIRLFLLKNTWQSRIADVGAPVMQKSVDVSSTMQNSGEYVQEVPRPTKSCNRGERGHERFRWPRIYEQMTKGSGSANGAPTPPVTPNPLTFYTFSGKHRGEIENPYPINARELSLAIGISARLITSIAKIPEKHYRRFKIPKANGSFRNIASPKLFLKVIQYWLKDYLLFRLPIHETCFSFIKNVSIEDNASPHTKMAYVGTIDIEDYFGSIKVTAVQSVLKRAGFTASASRIISKLVTLDDALPQGAPTSPIISNTFLFRFDEFISRWCKTHECTYTRYADDVTISGMNKSSVLQCIDRAEILLNRYGLKLNSKKTRIQSQSTRQVVTGLTVNELAQPSREQRRKVRAMLHNYQIGKLNDPKEIQRLRGWISYFRSFDHLKEIFQMPA